MAGEQFDCGRLENARHPSALLNPPVEVAAAGHGHYGRAAASGGLKERGIGA